MIRLSSPIEAIEEHYDVVVVGSGYGGAIAASRLARSGRRVCVLERGAERQPGEYPDTELEMLEALQLDSDAFHQGSRTGLYDIRLNDDVNVFMGCGLGGTSLVNANVSLRPDDRVFEDPIWPDELRADLATRLAEGYRRAEEMLGAQPYPTDVSQLAKLRALEQSAEAMGASGDFYRPPINVTFRDGVNQAGVDHFAAQGRADAEAAIMALEQRKAGSDTAESPAGAMQGRTWVTRVGVHVDRICSAWLIRRFIDREARFRFVAPKGYRPEPGELRFDMFEGEFTHDGDRCTFETLCRHFELRDRALGVIAELVHDIDCKDDKFGRGETAGFRLVIDGIVRAHADDETRLERGAAVLDDLYAQLSGWRA